MATTYALLVRGVNVGGKAALKMADLRSVLADLGLEKVRTYRQSGQAVVTAPRRTSAAALAGSVERALAQECGLKNPRVLALTHAQLGTIIDGNPYPDPEQEPTKNVVWFLLDNLDNLDKSGADLLKGFDAGQFAPEELTVSGPVIYLRLPDGQGRSRLLPPLQRAITVPITARNWKTVLALHDLTAGRP